MFLMASINIRDFQKKSFSSMTNNSKNKTITKIHLMTNYKHGTIPPKINPEMLLRSKPYFSIRSFDMEKIRETKNLKYAF